MEKKRNWHGVDASNEESLFGYGFLIRWRPDAKEFQAVHLCGFDDNGEKLFTYGWFDYYERREEMDDELLKGLSKMCGMTTEEYLQILSPSNLLSDLLSYQGIDETFWWRLLCTYLHRKGNPETIGTGTLCMTSSPIAPASGGAAIY